MDVIMINPYVVELIINDKELIEFARMMQDVLCSCKVVYEYDVLKGTYRRIFSKKEMSIMNDIENRIDLRKQQILKTKELKTF